MSEPDIVARLRDYESTVLAAPPYYRELIRIAAAEIERLRVERNQLRAEVVDRALKIDHDVCWDINSPKRKLCEEYAKARGWGDLWDAVNEQERLIRKEERHD